MADILKPHGHQDILDNPVLMALAQGSPGQALSAWQQWNSLPPELLSTVSSPPTNLKTALTLAQQVTKILDMEAQLWLVDYLQQLYWQQQLDARFLQALEQARLALRRFVQPRLVWEVTFMAMAPRL